MDSELEEALREVVLLIQRQSLTVIVAHRTETIMGADKILVMEDGRLVESGTHQDLMQRAPVYREFIEKLAT